MQIADGNSTLRLFGQISYAYSSERANSQRSNIAGLHAVLIILGAAALSFLFDAQEIKPAFYYPGMLAGLALMASVLIVPRRLIIYPILIILTVMPDVTQSSVDLLAEGRIRSATIWQIEIGPIKPSWIVFGLLTLVILRLNKIRMTASDRLAMSYFAVVPVVTSVFYGYFNHNLSAVITDLKFPLFLIMGIILFESFFRQFPKEFWRSLTFGFLALCGRFITDFAYLMFDVGRTMLSGVNRVSVDSGKIMIVFVFFFFIVDALEGRRKSLAYTVVLCVSLLMIAYQTRQLLVFAAVGMVFLVTFSDKLRVTKAIIGLVCLSLLIWPFVADNFHGVLTNMEKRFSSFFFWQSDFDASLIETARVTSIRNVAHLLWTKCGFLWGMGYGSWYSDEYVPFVLRYSNRFLSAFDAKSISIGQFYRVHELFFHFMLKFGIFGFAIYLALFSHPLWLIVKKRLFNSRIYERRKISLVLLCSSPIVLTGFFWTSKLLICYAFLIVVARNLLMDVFDKQKYFYAQARC